jgi:hypothetical protein
METVNFMAKRFKMVGYTFVGKLYHCAVNHPSGLARATNTFKVAMVRIGLGIGAGVGNTIVGEM